MPRFSTMETHIMVSKRRRMRVNANMIKLGTEGRHVPQPRGISRGHDRIIRSEDCSLDFHPILVPLFLSGDAFLNSCPVSVSSREVDDASPDSAFSIIEGEGLRRSRRCRNSGAIFPFIRQAEAPSLRVGSEMYLL
jgi:hypothetical protein